jgi:23S rRNA pseudouridine2605 synthase
MSDAIRLNKYLAQRLNLGRRAADALITDGRVLLNGKAAELGSRVTPDAVVSVDGRLLESSSTPAFLYVLMNKPAGYVCSRRQQGETPTIYSLLPPKYQHLKTVGRLDKDSSGLILLTNDGDFAHRLTHPSFAKVKKYEVALDKPLAPLHHQMINDQGIDLPDGRSQLQLERLHEGDDRRWLVIMHEGRNRQIRRTFAALSYKVEQLHRIQFGPYTLDLLESGKIQSFII